MKEIICGTGGRAPTHCAAIAACGDESGGKIRGRFLQDLIGLAQFFVLPLKIFDAILLFSRQTGTLSLVAFRLLTPDTQAVSRTAKLGGNRLIRG